MLEDPIWVELCRQSQLAIEQANAHYSHYRVGSALLLDNGNIVIGSNQENAVYPLGLCAERVALFNAASLHRGQEIKLLAVATEKDLKAGEFPPFPCGSCRQVILEFQSRQNSPIPLLIVGSDNRTYQIESVTDILPFGFTNESL